MCYFILKRRKKEWFINRKELYIYAMGVDEQFRNRGIGRELLEHIKKYAKDNGYTDLRLIVNEKN